MSGDLAARLRELEAASRPLEPGPAERAELRSAVVGVGERYLRADGDDATVPDGPIPAFVETAAPGAGLLDLPIGREGHDLDRVMELLERDVLHPGGHPASGGHLAYLTGGGLYHAALGDYLGALSNKYPSVFFTGPGPVRMENQVVRWTADLVGYPDGAAGHIASGGSIANLTAVVTARDAHGVGGGNVASHVVYSTAQAHHCIDKALRIAGLGEAPVRRIGLDAGYRMRPEELTRTIAEDRAAGLTPWLIVATAGTTDVGAVDPLSDLADVAEREGCWLHVDAAYGGYFLLTDDGRAKLAGIERSDSVVLDPHKSLFQPWGAGVVVVRDGAALAAAHGGSGPYLQDARRAGGERSPADVSPELTKPFRALRLWLPLVLMGTEPFAAALEEKLLLARYFHREVRELGFSVGPPPDLSVVVFRWAPDGLPLDQADAANVAIVEGLRRDGRIFLSSTELDGRFTIRMAALAHRTHRQEIDIALQLLLEQATRLTG